MRGRTGRSQSWLMSRLPAVAFLLLVAAYLTWSGWMAIQGAGSDIRARQAVGSTLNSTAHSDRPLSLLVSLTLGDQTWDLRIGAG